jgi:lysophospholipase L1-like esterase
MRRSRRARRLRLLAILTTTALAGLSAFGAVRSASASGTVSYVALGDSYSSGDGAGSYSDGACLESAKAYPVLWHDAHGGAFANETCAGATTADVLASQLGPLGASTTLVSVTIGGNDVGFTSVMETCVLKGNSACIGAVQKAESQAQASLPGALDNVLAAIAARAPGARVVVLGYPEFYDLARSSTCIGLSTTKRTYLNQGADVLDGVIQAAAGRHGDSFVDVRPFFASHQICDAGSYLISVDWLNLTDSYHPNAGGQRNGYLPALDSVTG